MWTTGGWRNQGYAGGSGVSPLQGHRGVIGPWVVVALVVLLGVAALVVDVGRDHRSG